MGQARREDRVAAQRLLAGFANVASDTKFQAMTASQIAQELGPAWRARASALPGCPSALAPGDVEYLLENTHISA